MVERFDKNDRRILKYPAVHPCEGISPATLVDSLITLSHTIDNYQSKFFPSQRRKARESIRQIGILSMFFGETRDRRSLLSDSVVLCFSELHHAFQKIQFLLEDCTRKGAKIFILMKAHFVGTQFLTLIRAIATALDILPLGSIKVSREVKELVELVAKQARKAKLEIDPDDEYTMKRVILILNQFENKFEPDPIIIKRVLDYLGIRSWSECNQEIKFLEEEISWECLENNERDVPLLSSLVGFMSYCRGVLFENSVLENSDDEQSEGRANIEMLSCLNPEDFRCPISLELMTDPVTVSTGQTYDRASIQKWFKSGHLLCPKTGEKLKTTELVPNLNLRKVIQQFCADHGVSLAKSRTQNHDISRTILPGSPSAAESIKFLCEFLSNRLCNGTEKQQNKAAYEIRLLAKSNIFNRHCLIEAGVIPPLLTLLSSTDSTIQENAIAALLKLSKHSNGKRVIINHGGLEAIVAVLKYGLKQESRQIASATIFYLSTVVKYQKLIGELPEAIPALIEQIKNGTSCGKKNALSALFGILLYPRNHERVITYGIVPLLVNLLGTNSDKPEIVTNSLAVLATLAESFDGSDAILKASGLSLVIKTMQNSESRAGKEYCVSILLSLCNNLGVEVIALLAKESSLIGTLYSLGGCHGSEKARLLIRIIHRFHETSTSSLMGGGISQEQFIHVR